MNRDELEVRRTIIITLAYYIIIILFTVNIFIMVCQEAVFLLAIVTEIQATISTHI